MAWNQIVTPNLDPYTYVNGKLLTDWYGWCLATVRCAYNAPFSGLNAGSGWTDYTQVKHEDRNFPVGVYFPIWFSGYGGLGHVAFAYVNDQGSMNIWTSPFTHTPYFYTGYHDVDTLARDYKLDAFVGWSEDMGGMRVIEFVPDQPILPPPPAPVVVNAPIETPSPTPEVVPEPTPAVETPQIAPETVVAPEVTSISTTPPTETTGVIVSAPQTKTSPLNKILAILKWLYLKIIGVK